MTELSENPLLASWTGEAGAAPFSKIKAEHFRPAFAAAIAERRAEIAAIRDNPAPPDFANTILALERAGKTLDRIARVFSHLASADTNDALQAIEREMAPVFARERNVVYLDATLFGRVDAVHRAPGPLDAEAKRLVERYRLAFTRSGADLEEPAKQRLAEISERLATLSTAFAQNVLADEREFALVLDDEDALSGLPAEFLAASAADALGRGHAGKHVVTLSRSSAEPFLQFSSRRDLREIVWRAFVARGTHPGAHDNRPLMSEILKLRAERAKWLGYGNFADFRLDDTMAKTPGNAMALLRRVWTPARAAALAEADALTAMIAEEGGNFELKPWDWRFYAERRRKALYDFDEGAVKAHLPLERIVEAAFAVAHRLFGLSFQPAPDVDPPHADARVWRVLDARGATVAWFIGDYFARASKRSGAWMSALRSQSKLDGDVKPIVVNVMNFARGEGGACLLSYDEAHTLFHEFGHGLHGMLSNVTYPTLSGTSVARDFVELPSQLYEHWMDAPEVLREFARHHETGAPMPEPLFAALRAARTYGQGFGTVEFVASALVDMAAHAIAEPGDIDMMKLEADELASIGMPEAIAPRHGAAHFQHIFAGEGYCAGYYSYLWSEVLDADAFEAFEETGDVFDPELARRLKTYIYSAGNLRPPDEAYEAFRGRAPAPDALLRKRGFAKALGTDREHEALGRN